MSTVEQRRGVQEGPGDLHQDSRLQPALSGQQEGMLQGEPQGSGPQVGRQSQCGWGHPGGEDSYKLAEGAGQLIMQFHIFFFSIFWPGNTGV